MNNKLWFLFVLVGCGGGDGGTLLVDVEDPASFCRAAAQTGCETMYACLTVEERQAKGLPSTQAECERKYESACEDVVDACTDATHGYASAAAEACLNEMTAATCNDAGDAWLDAPSCDNICQPTAGDLQLRWAFNPPTYSCTSLNIQTVAVYSVAADGKSYIDAFDCYAGSGVTDVLPIGTYSVHLELFDYNNQKRWSGLAMAVKLDRERVDLGTITIPVAQQ